MELDACIPANDCVRLIRQFVEEMDLTALYATYERMPSEKYASPEIMLKIMLYAYHERKDVSSRTIEKNCKRDINYIFLQKTALLVGDIIQRQELKPLWQKQVKKKHVKKILKKLRAKANEESLEFVSGRGHIKTQLQRDIEALEAALEKLKAYNLDLDTEHSFLTESAIGYLHDNGIKVNCWTVDDKSRAEELAAWGVDFITSNILE